MSTLHKIQISLLLLLTCGLSLGQVSEWTHDQGFRDDLLYLHVMENYAYNPSWVYEWEKKFYSSNNAFLNFGSVEIHDLYNDIRILLNVPLDSNWTFTADYKTYATHFINEEIQYMFMGLERRIYSNIKVYMQFNPGFDKEFIDGKIGVAWYNDDLSNYIRLALQYDQFVYEEKNDYKGSADKQPRAVNWNIRLGNEKWSIFSEGLKSGGFSWNYPDSIKSLGLKIHQGLTNYSVLRLYYFINKMRFLRLETNQYNFEEQKKYYLETKNYKVDNKIWSMQLLYSHYISINWRIRASARYLEQQSNAAGLINYQYKRSEIMPSLWIDYQTGRHNIELAVMESYYDWKSESLQQEYNYTQNSNIEKVKLAYTYKFKNNSRLQLSLSHVFSIFGFGGFDLNYLLFF